MADVNLGGTGLTPKTLQNIRSNTLAALRQVGATDRPALRTVPLSEPWTTLHRALPDKRMRNGLSRFLRFCSALELQPEQVDEPIRGGRRINEPEAEVVRRIFREYAAGKSPRAIAVELNAEGIPGPHGGAWGQSTINGNRQRGIGILNNELYIGHLVWNRQRFIKDPTTGKRQARPNPPEAWVIEDVPDLCIIDDDLWQTAKPARETSRCQNNQSPANPASGTVAARAISCPGWSNAAAAVAVTR